MADDAQWLDRGSLDTLAFAARRLESEPVALLLGARGSVPPAGFERDFPELTLPPLSTPDAGRLLDAQPHPPRGRAREQVLAQAAGNPMALIELSRVIAADPAAGRRWAAEPLPLDRPARPPSWPPGSRALPAAGAGRAAARGGRRQRGPGRRGVPGLTADALAPAEAAGLIRVDTSGPQFTHPLVRSAVYHAVPFAERAAAHLQIAEALRDQPDRYAWHLAAAALEPDERVAALLEETGGPGAAPRRHRRRGAGAGTSRRAQPGRARTRPGGCWPPPASPCPPGRRTGCANWRARS